MVDYTLYDPTAVSGSSEDEHTIQAKLTKILVGAIDDDVDRKHAGSVVVKQANASPLTYQRATTSRHWYTDSWITVSTRSIVTFCRDL
jgi:hypothetical protein